jgi:hypothetical protein
MNYSSPQALRTALEQRIANIAQEQNVAVNRLRRRVTFERVVRRLTVAEPDQWVLKGGMALEARLHDRARVTKDIDLGLRDVVTDGEDLRDRVIDALARDPDSDEFVFSTGTIARLGDDSSGEATWRLTVKAQLAGRTFDSIKLDISPRSYELTAVDRLKLPTALAFAGIPPAEIQVIDLARHAAEKFHGMTRTFGSRENTRARDLVDLVLLYENDLLNHHAVWAAAIAVWRERDGTEPPRRLPPLPESWQDRYVKAAADLDLQSSSFADGVDVARAFWLTMYPTEDS